MEGLELVAWMTRPPLVWALLVAAITPEAGAVAEAGDAAEAGMLTSSSSLSLVSL